jgi:cytochrome c1
MPAYVVCMKFPAVLLSAVIAVGVMQAQTPPAPKPTASGKAAPEVKKEEAMGVIEGTTLNRPNGHFLGLTLQDGKFKLTFYDKKKKPEKVDVTRATARWPNKHGPGDNRTVLNPAGDGTYLMGAQFVRGPYSFKLFITLLRGEGEQAAGVENYTLDFRG